MRETQLLDHFEPYATGYFFDRCHVMTIVAPVQVPVIEYSLVVPTA